MHITVEYVQKAIAGGNNCRDDVLEATTISASAPVNAPCATYVGGSDVSRAET